MKLFHKNRCSRLQPAMLAALILGLSLMMLILLPAAPSSGQAEDATSSAPTAILATPLPTDIPQEWKDNYQQTTGIIAGAVVLAIIIIGGTLHTLAQNKPRQP